MISLGPGVVERSLDTLRRCGAGHRECVVVWVADHGQPELVVDVVHPTHTAGTGWYEIDAGWLTAFGFELADLARRAVAQVHTHPGCWVEPSDVDEEFVLVPSPGFVSVIVPAFAGDPDIHGWGVHVLQPDGTWLADTTAIAL